MCHSSVYLCTAYIRWLLAMKHLETLKVKIETVFRMLRQKLAFLLLIRRRRRQKKARKYWVHPLWENRLTTGAYFVLLPELKAHPDKFFDYMRMDTEIFDILLQTLNERFHSVYFLITGEPWTTFETFRLTKISIRTAICAEERLMITIRYLATGESYRSLSFQFRLGVMSVSRIVSETCAALYEVLHHDYLEIPKTADEWRRVASGFWENCNIPNTLGIHFLDFLPFLLISSVLGAIDGKHILIRKPPGSGTKFFNYKGRTWTVLMAICDADYYCIYASFGHFGHMSDGGDIYNAFRALMFLTFAYVGIYDRSDFKRKLTAGEFNIPSDFNLPETAIQVPHFFIGDGAFPLSRRMMKPFPGNNLSYNQMNFNYRWD